MHVSSSSVCASRPYLPPVSPPKAHELHPAWRIVSGGITMANLRNEDWMDDDEQAPLGAPQQSRRRRASSSEPRSPFSLTSATQC